MNDGDLTTAQRRVYDALVTLSQEGWPASVREVAEVAGYQGTSTVQMHLLILERKGFARRHPRAGNRKGWLPGLRRTT